MSQTCTSIRQVYGAASWLFVAVSKTAQIKVPGMRIIHQKLLLNPSHFSWFLRQHVVTAVSSQKLVLHQSVFNAAE